MNGLPRSPRAQSEHLQNGATTIGFMPRILVLTTLPHSRPTTHRFERINGRYSLRLEARRSVGLPYGLYPRLILTYLTTQALRTKSPEIDLGRTPNDFARKLGLTPISGPRGTCQATSRPASPPRLHPIPLAVLQGLPNARERSRPDHIQRPRS